MSPLTEQESIELARMNLSPQDALIYELHWWGEDDRPPLTARSTAKRMDLHAATVYRALPRIRRIMDAAEEAAIGVGLFQKGVLPEAYLRERFEVVVAHGHKAGATPDITPMQAIGPDIHRTRKRMQNRIEAQMRDIAA